MKNSKIAVIGLGYVGLPLARLFSTKYQTIGFDINEERVKMLQEGHDKTLEVDDLLLQQAIKSGLQFTSNLHDIRDYNVYIVAVPTPVDHNNYPDLTPLLDVSRMRRIEKGTLSFTNRLSTRVTEEGAFLD